MVWPPFHLEHQHHLSLDFPGAQKAALFHLEQSHLKVGVNKTPPKLAPQEPQEPQKSARVSYTGQGR